MERELSSLSESLLARRRKGTAAVPAVTEADTVEQAAADADSFPSQLLFAAAAGTSCSVPAAAAAGMQEVLWGDGADFFETELDVNISTAAKLAGFSSHPWPPLWIADGSSWIFLDFLTFSFLSAETLLKKRFLFRKHDVQIQFTTGRAENGRVQELVNQSIPWHVGVGTLSPYL